MKLLRFPWYLLTATAAMAILALLPSSLDALVIAVGQLRTRTTTSQVTSHLAMSATLDRAASSSSSATTTTTAENDGARANSNNSRAALLTHQGISSLSFRELKRELEARGQASDGTTSLLRTRLRAAIIEECGIRDDDGNEFGADECGPESAAFQNYIDFVDESDPTLELVAEIEAKCKQNHWKAATRKLKKLTRRFPDTYVPEDVFLRVLETCMENRLQGARASEPARKIMEQLVEQGYYIPEKDGNYCIQNCLGETGPNSTHQGFGGVDTALAMVAAMDRSMTPIQSDTYEKLAIALAKEGSVEEALPILRRLVVEMSVTPPLATFTTVARFAVMTDNSEKKSEHAERIFTLLAYAKASGYELDGIAATEEGRSLLASAVIAADRVGNDAMGFRLLKAASNAQGVAPDRGDAMVAMSSSAAQRACTLIHKRAVNKAVEDGEWQLAVKVLELMLQRFLKPSPWVWRNVVTCCAKAEKSKKATGLLLDWVKLSEQGKAEKPPLSVFNTCVNACEICNEQDLTLMVLDSMKKTHETDGNLITFNIALKRLAKLGNSPACEGIIVGMLKADVEPSVVSYTTAIAACASSEVKQPAVAYEWLRRMRSRNVQPNVISYNTALAACTDGTMEGSFLASKIAKEMLADVDKQLQEGDDSGELDEYRNVIPDASTKVFARRLMQQLKQNWSNGAIDKRVATETIRVPLLQLVDFQKSQAAERARQQYATRRKAVEDEDEAPTTKRVEVELESLAHRVAEV